MKTFEGFITDTFLKTEVAGAFRTETTNLPGVKFQKATLIVHEEESEKVYQYRYKNACGNWLITRRLYTEEDAANQFAGSTEYEKHSGPFEVPL